MEEAARVRVVECLEELREDALRGVDRQLPARLELNVGGELGAVNALLWAVDEVGG